MLEKIELVKMLVDGIEKSLTKQKKAKMKGDAMVGYGLSAHDSRESIKRRILVCREELLEISKELDGGVK